MHKESDAALNVYWGDTHHNTYQFGPQDPPLDRICEDASKYLDFYAAAYYTGEASAFKQGGHVTDTTERRQVVVENCKSREKLDKEWQEVQALMKAANRPGRFVTFPGYEWQGDGTCGDHNVFYRSEGPPVFRVCAVPDLYEKLRGLDAIAIPHHTGYRPGRRAPDWSRCDERISPFTETFSKHGCSETDEEYIGLRNNSHMGPGAGGTTYADALARGLHLGVICSTDNWNNVPGQYGEGLMACLASDLTRDSLWAAFLARRVYGVSGDRIRLDFSVNDAPMGAIIGPAAKRRIRVAVRGSDALDRVEILRNNRVLATHCHQGTWTFPAPGQRAKFKFRAELGWGPRPNELSLPDRDWTAELRLDRGRWLDWEPCWISRAHSVPKLDGGSATFRMRTSLAEVLKPHQSANVFEFEASAETPLAVRVNGLEDRGTVGSFAESSRVMWFKDECAAMLKEKCGIDLAGELRQDPLYHMAYKAKLHRVIPERGYTALCEIEDDEPLDGETHYRVRVEQRNGQRAWSSPVWIRAG